MLYRSLSITGKDRRLSKSLLGIQIMTIQIWIRCLFVSFVLAILAPLFSMSLEMPIEQLAIESYWFTPDEIAAMSPQEFAEKVEPHLAPGHNVFEKWLFASTFPEFWPMFIKAALTWFIGFIIATSLVSYMHVRKQKNA